jgi:hypothetical protein
MEFVEENSEMEMQILASLDTRVVCRILNLYPAKS